MRYHELVNNTTWEESKSEKKSNGYAISPNEMTVQLDDKDNWSFSFITYPICDEDENEILFSPITGESLVSKCPECSRPIKIRKQTFCTGCGNKIVEGFYLSRQTAEIMNEVNFDTRAKLSELTYLLEQLHRLIRDIDDIDAEVQSIDSTFIDKLYNKIKNEAERKKLAESGDLELWKNLSNKIENGVIGFNESLKASGFPPVQLIPKIGKLVNLKKWINSDRDELYRSLSLNIKLIEGLVYHLKERRTEEKDFNIESIKTNLFREISIVTANLAEQLATNAIMPNNLYEISGTKPEDRWGNVKKQLEVFKEITRLFDGDGEISESFVEKLNKIANTTIFEDPEKDTTETEEGERDDDKSTKSVKASTQKDNHPKEKKIKEESSKKKDS